MTHLLLDWNAWSEWSVAIAACVWMLMVSIRLSASASVSEVGEWLGGASDSPRLFGGYNC